MRILLTGASGQLGAYLIEHLRAEDGHELIAWSGRDGGERNGVPLIPVDLADSAAIQGRLDEARPDAVLHAAAISAARACFDNLERARLINVEATRQIAEWCRERGRRLVFTSTDLVFDGRRPWNLEDGPAAPILTYGRTKRAAEASVLAVPRGLVARVSLMYGPSRCGRESYFDRALDALRRGEPQSFFEDEYRTPLDLPTAADILGRLVVSEARGLVHVAGTERVSRFELMRRLAVALGMDPSLIRPNRQADVPSPEPRPADVSLDTSRLVSLLPDLERPTIEEATARFGDVGL